MASATPPQIFAPSRRLASRRRAMLLQASPGATRYLIDDMVEDVTERLSFLRVKPKRALVIGDWTGVLALTLGASGTEVTNADPADGFEQEQPFPATGFDFIASLGTLDTANDLPGALIHLRAALAPGGLVIASLIGAGSLPTLREAMLTADGERPAPRLHPQVDVRAGGQLLQRAGWVNPVVDSRTLEVRFGSMQRLVQDLREQALGNVLTRSGPPLSRKALAQAEAAFTAHGEDGRTTERFEILTLSGWRG